MPKHIETKQFPKTLTVQRNNWNVCLCRERTKYPYHRARGVEEAAKPQRGLQSNKFWHNSLLWKGLTKYHER